MYFRERLNFDVIIILLVPRGTKSRVIFKCGHILTSLWSHGEGSTDKASALAIWHNHFGQCTQINKGFLE